jgi:hypothetical protein
MFKSDVELLAVAHKVVQEAEKDAERNPAGEWIQVIVVEPQKTPYKKTIPNTLEAITELIGGYMEGISLWRETETGAPLFLICNEEGKLLNLPFNRKIMGFDTIVGTFFITAVNKMGDHVSIDDPTADKLIKQFNSTEVYL